MYLWEPKHLTCPTLVAVCLPLRGVGNALISTGFLDDFAP
jgi:hypothetical protein